MNVLVTIPFSHFCEKARWALDHTRTPYVEQRLLPPLHLLGTLPRGGRSTPLLVTDEGTRLPDSTDILRWLDDRSPGALYPRDPNARREVEALEDELDQTVGPAVRRVVYQALFSSEGDVLTPMFRVSSRGMQRVASPVIARVAKPFIRRGLKIDAARAARSRVKLDAALDTLDARLADGRVYLVGDTLTAADLTLAALLAPLVQPPEHPVLGPIGSRAPALDAFRDEYRARPSGRHALALYRNRAPSMER